jgi:hypothetical protein
MASGRVWQQGVVLIIPHISTTPAIRWNWSHHTIITRFCWISGVPSHTRLVWKLIVLWLMTRTHLVFSSVNTRDHSGKQLFSATCIIPLYVLASLFTVSVKLLLQRTFTFFHVWQLDWWGRKRSCLLCLSYFKGMELMFQAFLTLILAYVSDVIALILCGCWL